MQSRLVRVGLSLLKGALWALAVLVVLAAAYAGFNTPFSREVRTVPAGELLGYITYLNEHVSDPQAFVAQQFDHYDVVLLGEMHWKQQDVKFVARLIPYLFRTKGVRIFGWEFGASDFQAEADAVVNAPTFDRRRAIGLMRRSYFAWNFEEYLDIIRTIWEVNQSVPDPARRIRFLQLGFRYNPRELNSTDLAARQRELQRLGDYEEKMGHIVDTEVLEKHAKALWYLGLHHAFTRYRQPAVLFVKTKAVRGGAYLWRRYPDRVYMIGLSQPFPDRLVLFRVSVPAMFGKRLRFVSPFGSALEHVYRAYGKPFAVDAQHSKFGDMVDTHSYYAFDRWNGLTLREMCDGYIVLCSIAEMEPVALIPDWVTSDAELDEVRSVLPPEDAARTRDLPALLKYIDAETGRSQVKLMRPGR